MSTNTKTKKITLTPSWKHYFIAYVLSVLAIPLFGIGLIAFYFVRKKHKNIRFAVTDTQISSIDSKYHRNIDLVNIEKVTIEQGWLQEKLNVGTLLLSTSATSVELIGMENPGQLKQMIEEAIARQKKQQEKKNFRRTQDPKHKPGSMDKMDYLTGLWHQGLLSEEDFESERKNFE
ncbi:PH domain-containing protein [Halalkalibaculum sp. DA384]|uniref:PH domain-containing protein n=1 Tax=Halalkalibaculum sp. DA384 TaxID=3373606 RepID=UPI003754F9C7